MKFLYPIKKLNIKPWIKYWLLKKDLNPIVLSDLIEGTSPITIEKVYEGTTLQELAFKGQTIQDRIVKGDNYININEESFRVDLSGKNLFNKTTIVAGDIKGSASPTRLSSRQVLWLDVGTYTMSTNAVSPFRYCCLIQNVGIPPLPEYPKYILDSGWKTSNSYTFTITTAGYFTLLLSKTSENIRVDEVADFEYQLEKRKSSNRIYSICCKSY